MRVLLDEQLPVDLAPELHGHQVDTVVGRGWAGVKNSDLLRRMLGGYDVFVTMGRGVEFQHNLSADCQMALDISRSEPRGHWAPLDDPH